MSEEKEALRNRALKEAARYRYSGLDADTIYARLEKQGIPADLAREAAYIVVQDRYERMQKTSSEFNYLQIFLRLGVGVGAAVLSYFLLDGRAIILPIGLLVSGVIWAIIAAAHRK